MSALMWTAIVFGCFLLQQAIGFSLFWALAYVLDWLIERGDYFTKAYTCIEVLFYAVGIAELPTFIALRKWNSFKQLKGIMDE